MSDDAWGWADENDPSREPDPSRDGLGSLQDALGGPGGVDELTEELAAPTHWPSLDPAEVPERLRALAAWVEGWVARFDVPGSEVPPCWFLHTGLVEVLSAVADAERGAYAVVAAPSAAVEWHRQMREERAHLKELASRTGCTAVEHRAAVRLGESVTATARFEQHLATLEEGRP